jgi:hypothetical protein
MNQDKFKIRLKYGFYYFCKGLKINILEKRLQENKEYDGLGFRDSILKE